jgi:pimeloyl-ACP methyl ester carboxylesterase
VPNASLNGISIYYEDHGSGFPILFTHGYSLTATQWEPQIGPLMAAGYRVITWDARGHGDTDSPEDPADYTEQLTVADMKALLDHLGVERAVIGGLSMGGYMSMAFALAHPEMTVALVLSDTGPGYRNEAARAVWNRRADDRARRLETDGIPSLRAGPELAAAMARHRSIPGLMHASRGMARQMDDGLIGRLEGITAPTLVLVGENDAPFQAAAAYIASHIAGARGVVVIPGAGHVANIANPAAFNAAVLTFLAEVAPPGG